MQTQSRDTGNRNSQCSNVSAFIFTMVGQFFGFFLFFWTYQFHTFNNFPLFPLAPSEWTGSSGRGWEVRETFDFALKCFKCRIHRERNSERESMTRKAIQSLEEHRGRDKDACCGVSLLIKIDFLLLNPAGLHQVNSSSERLWTQSCCSALSLHFSSFFFFFNSAFSHQGGGWLHSLSTILLSRSFPTENGGGDWKKDGEG